MGARFEAPRFELADIVRQHRTALESQLHLSPEQRRALTDIAQCRTTALGGHLDECSQHCGYEHPSYNSCLMGSAPFWGARVPSRSLQREVRLIRRAVYSP